MVACKKINWVSISHNAQNYKFSRESQRECSTDKMLALHITDPSMINDTTYGTTVLPGINPELRAPELRVRKSP